MKTWPVGEGMSFLPASVTIFFRIRSLFELKIVGENFLIQPGTGEEDDLFGLEGFVGASPVPIDLNAKDLRSLAAGGELVGSGDRLAQGIFGYADCFIGAGSDLAGSWPIREMRDGAAGFFDAQV